MRNTRRAGSRLFVVRCMLVLVALSAVSACTSAYVRGEAGAGRAWGASRACPPAFGAALASASSYDSVSRYLRAREADMRTLEPVQMDEAVAVERGVLTRTRVRAIPGPCAHRDSVHHMLDGYVLGMITTSAALPTYGLSREATVFVWITRELSPGINADAALLIDLAETNPARWQKADIEYHDERVRFEKAYARFALLSTAPPTSSSGAAPGPSLFRLASLERSPSALAFRGDSTGEGNTAAWFSCLMGCCRVRPTSK